MSSASDRTAGGFPATHPLGAIRPARDGSREWAIRVLASLAKGWLEAGAQVGAASGEAFLPPQAGAEQATRILDALARLGDGSQPLGEVLASGPMRSVGSAVRVVVTSDLGFAAVPKRAEFADDAVSDMYGPPHKPSKDQERMVAAGLAQVIEKHGRLSDNRRPSRDFDSSRQAPKRDYRLESQGARGIFEVEGRTPLHMRLAAYDIYSDVENRWLESRKPGSLMLEAEGGDWMRLGQFRDAAGWYADEDRHRLKVADLKTNLVPTPAMVARFRIDKVDNSEYYERDYDGVFAIAGKKSTPPGVAVTTDCRTLDPAALPESAFAGTTSGLSPVYAEVPDAYRATLDRIAQAWAGGLPRGGPQVEAIANRLRDECAVDPFVIRR